eukprot:TRINITY_DN32929_c0_g1_i1.p1 TRINITY_DN32929_c0_g1~~TRINITY_DN32929_c0_g1_i1.p1  ORF type:complete len:215 (+),score=17.64 TRINITY_DN32929_c0_g1_i1:51-695(+)
MLTMGEQHNPPLPECQFVPSAELSPQKLHELTPGRVPHGSQAMRCPVFKPGPVSLENIACLQEALFMQGPVLYDSQQVSSQGLSLEPVPREEPEFDVLTPGPVSLGCQEGRRSRALTPGLVPLGEGKCPHKLDVLTPQEFVPHGELGYPGELLDGGEECTRWISQPAELERDLTRQKPRDTPLDGRTDPKGRRCKALSWLGPLPAGEFSEVTIE